jgi:hypothetical protein
LAEASDEPPENRFGRWFIADLVEITYMEPWSKKLVEHNWGDAHPDQGDRFGSQLAKFAPWDAIHNEGFDPWSDADTWSEANLLESIQTLRNATARNMSDSGVLGRPEL